MVSWRFATSVFLILLLGSARQFARVDQSASPLPDIDSTPVLEPNTKLEMVLRPRETQSFEIRALLKRYLRITIEKPGLNVTLRLLGPGGAEETVIESSEDDGDTVALSIIGSAERQLLAIRSNETGAVEGRYRVSLSDAAQARPEDEKRVAAERWYARAEQPRPDSSAPMLRRRLDQYEKSLALWREIDDRGQQAQVLSRIGKLHVYLDDLKAGESCLREALSLSRAVHDPRVQAYTLHALGNLHNGKGENQQALDDYVQALELYRAVKDRRAEDNTLNNLGLTYIRLDKASSAFDPLKKALALAQLTGDRSGEAKSIFYLGLAYVGSGEAREGLKYLQQSREMVHALKDRSMEAYILAEMAGACDQLGELQQALDFSNQALAIQRDLGDVFGQASALNDLGLFYQELGETNKALDVLRQALPLHRKVEDRTGMAFALLLEGLSYSDIGLKEKAPAYFEQALVLYRAVSYQQGEANTLNAMADALRALNQPEKALERYKQALLLHRKIGHQPGEAETLTGLGSVYLQLGKTQESFEELDEAVQIARKTGDQAQEAAALFEMARAQKAANQLPQALASITRSIELTEKLRRSVAGLDTRASYLAKVRDRYEFLVALLMLAHREHPAEGFDAKALESSERSRARVLLDLLNENGTNIREGIEPALLDQEHQLQAMLNAKAAYKIRLLSRPHAASEAGTLEDEIAALSVQYQQIEAQIRERSPHYAGLTQPQPLTTAELQRLLDSDTTLIEYCLGEERSFVWVLRQDSLASYVLPNRTAIETISRRAYEELRSNQFTRGHSSLDDLGRMLLNPLTDSITSKRLVFVTEGALEYIPFSLLPDTQGVPLIATHEIISLPSASTLALLRKEIPGHEPPQKLVAIFADPVFSPQDPRVSMSRVSQTANPAGPKNLKRPSSPPSSAKRSAQDAGLLSFERLSESRREAKAIIELAAGASGLLALDFDANRETALSGVLSQYRIVHFASHALLDSREPALSGIVLSLVDRMGHSQDGFLRINEIFNLRLNADLVVLSACQTALGREVRGEGLTGLTRAFMYAGAPRIVASLWEVPDRATAELMTRFYRAMLEEGLRPAAALRKAQISMMSDKQWSASHYWAGFVLQGEWK
jgi:CHAT domain-containing protein/Tfp pilus assembly protein PilF